MAKPRTQREALHDPKQGPTPQPGAGPGATTGAETGAGMGVGDEGRRRDRDKDDGRTGGGPEATVTVGKDTGQRGPATRGSSDGA